MYTRRNVRVLWFAVVWVHVCSLTGESLFMTVCLLACVYEYIKQSGFFLCILYNVSLTVVMANGVCVFSLFSQRIVSVCVCVCVFLCVCVC